MFEDKSVKIFSSRDKIRNQMIEYAKFYLDIPEINFTKTSYLSYLINVISACIANNTFYSGSVYRELFLTKARQSESVHNWASIFGYSTRLATPATVDVTVKINTTFNSSSEIIFNGRRSIPGSNLSVISSPTEFSASSNVGVGSITFIPKYDTAVSLTIDRGQLINASVSQYEENSDIGLDLPFRISSDNKEIYFKMRLEQISDNVFDFEIPNLSPRQFYSKTFNFEGYMSDIKLQTRNSEVEGSSWVDWDWERNNNSIFLSDASKPEFSFVTTDKGIKINFGNNIKGMQPNSGDEARLIISTTKGYAGNVISGSVSNSGKVYLREVENGRIDNKNFVDVTALNYTPAVGGEDYPTLDEIRSEAIATVTSNNRLVSESDFENISTIVEGLPVHHAKPVLKRSDLKRNEITLFSDLMYMGEIVPIKNDKIIADINDLKSKDANVVIQPRYALLGHGIDGTSAEVYTMENITNDFNVYTLRIGKDVITDDDGNEMYPLFNMQLNSYNNTVEYFYMFDELIEKVYLEGYYETDPIIFPNNCKYTVYDELVESRNDDGDIKYVPIEKVKIEFSCKTTILNSIQTPKCYLRIGDGGIEGIEMTTELDIPNSKVKFVYNAEMLKDIPEGEITFYFELFQPNISEGGLEKVSSYQSKATIKKILSEFMYSLAVQDTSGRWTIYDVPLIKKEYWDFLVANDLHIGFIEDIYLKISAFDVSSYKMITDFINLKFATTFGKLSNLVHNPIKDYIRGINLDSQPSTLTKGRFDTTLNKTVYEKLPHPNWASTDTLSNPWNHPSKGFVAFYDYNYRDWRFKQLSTNDILIHLEDGENGEEEQPVIYNGFNIVKLEDKEIPLKINIDIWLNRDISGTEQAMILTVKDTLIKELYSKFGYDKNIYVSEITNIVQQIQGISFCRVLKPEHDIFFNYDVYKDFTQQQLLEYSPQMVMFTKNSIFVNIRN